MDDERYDIFAGLTEGSANIQKAVVLELLKEDTASDQMQSRPALWAHFLAACITSIAVFIIEMFLISVQRKSGHGKLPPQVFCASSESNTSNLHLQRLIKSTDKVFDVLLLESPIKRFENKLVDVAKVRTYWCRSFLTDLKAITGYLVVLKKMWLATSQISAHRRVQARSLTMTFVRLLRGMSISRFLRMQKVNRLVFSLSGNACTSMIELEMKGIAETIHWLHGVGLGFKFDSFSDKTLVNNEYDYHFYGNGISGQAIFFPDTSRRITLPLSLVDLDTVVLYSNLVHPGNPYFAHMGVDVERELLSIISARFSGKELVIKPHPSAFRILGDRLDEYNRFLKQYKFRIWNEARKFEPEKTLFISTVSTTFIDLIAIGKGVLLYDKYSDKFSGFQQRVSEELRFWDEETFEKAVGLLDDPDRFVAALKAFAVQSQDATFAYLSS